MSTCFVMQPFDGGTFDKRYKDVIKPAIEASGLEPYRVDEDPRVSIPIDDIERGIRESRVCLAEITTDNPNVWFELGFAIASRRDVVLLCSDERSSHFPFDIQHRTIIRYKTDSTQDFTKLEHQITDRIHAILQKEEALGKASSPLVEVEGLSQHETVALVSLAENLESPSDSVSQYIIQQDMERIGFTRIATFLALSALLEKRFLASAEDTDFNGNLFMVYRITQQGTEWLQKNQERLVLRAEPAKPTEQSPDDDIPF